VEVVNILSTSASRLRGLLEGHELVVVAECLSAITARVVEELDFRVTYCGGNALGTFHHAVPDYGLMSPAELAGHVSRIADAVELPLIVDADQGGETIANVRRTVRVLESAGAAGLHIEDSQNPKHSRVANALISMSDMAMRITAAAEARRDADFVIIARCEGLFNRRVYGTECTIEEIIERGMAYAAAGADAYMPICMDPEDIDVVADAVKIPLIDINQPTSAVVGSKLRMIIHSGWAGPSAVNAFKSIALGLREHGRIERESFQFADRSHLINQSEYDRLIGRWAELHAQPTLEDGKPVTAY
jgi:2-methylisocitrate lyase-like PEP mutase family enzyme